MFLYICDNSSYRVGNIIIDNLKSIATTFTPTTDLFDDGSEISFVSYFFGMNINEKDNTPKFFYPNYQKVEVVEDKKFVISSTNILNAICSGKVIAVGFTENNQKYIEIEHSSGYISKYIGIDNIGVATGDSVLANKPIGLTSLQDKIEITITKNNVNTRISEIKWND